MPGHAEGDGTGGKAGGEKKAKKPTAVGVLSRTAVCDSYILKFFYIGQFYRPSGQFDHAFI